MLGAYLLGRSEGRALRPAGWQSFQVDDEQ
jgi:hypothetical protein